MINVDNKVRNIYYMLCYSFYGEQLNKKSESMLGEEAFENIYNLFSMLLCLILKNQLKKGIYKEYVNIEDEMLKIRGKINIDKTLNNNLLIRKKIYCSFDDFNENCLLNKVIKTTLYYLLKSNKIGVITKLKIKKTIKYFSEVDIIEIKQINWNQIQYTRNNISYKFVIDLCKLILNGLIVSDKKGNSKFMEFLDDIRVSTIYENFVRAYFRKHFPELNACSKKLYLNSSSTSNFIPIMKTDITLKYNDRTLIIDTKFYSSILRNNYLNENCKTISNSNIYQILAYVDSQDPYKNGNVYGMLLYAQTINEPVINIKQELNKHLIMIRTLDMNDSWENIKSSLNNIAIKFEQDEFQNDALNI